MITCTFAGHRAAVDAADEWAIPEALAEAVEALLAQDDAFQFYFGGMGWFDLLCAREVRRAKLAAPGKRIELALVQPYPRKIEGEDIYDAAFVPEELRKLPPRAAIPARNRWLVEHSQHLIAYVRRAGGAATTLHLARARGLAIHEL